MYFHTFIECDFPENSMPVVPTILSLHNHALRLQNFAKSAFQHMQG